MLKNSNVEPFNRTSLKVFRKTSDIHSILFTWDSVLCFVRSFVFFLSSTSSLSSFFFLLSLECYGLSISIWRVDVIMRHPSKTFIHCELGARERVCSSKRRITYVNGKRRSNAMVFDVCLACQTAEEKREKKLNITQQKRKNTVVCQTKRATLKPKTARTMNPEQMPIKRIKEAN